MINKERYQRQIILKEFGEAGQQKLRNARLLIVGAGGLGCPALQYLVSSGVGAIGIVDFDVVDLTNLHRQILYTVDDIGKPKAIVAEAKLKLLNSEIKITPYNLKLDNQNALSIISNYDLVIDGSDNFTTRYLVNDACVLLNKPLVYGAVLRFEGQVGVFNLADKNGIKANYRDLFPNPPDSDSILSCNEIGVLGVVPGVIGIMQATEAIKIITGIGEVLVNQIVTCNLLTNSSFKFNISINVNSTLLIPKNETEFLNFNYKFFCGTNNMDHEITYAAFDKLKSTSSFTIIDVREFNELPEVNEFKFLHIPLSDFENKILAIDIIGPIVFYCQTGKRSSIAVDIIKNKFSNCEVYSLRGGILGWKNYHNKIIIKNDRKEN